MAEDKELRNFFVLKTLNEHGGEVIMALRRMIVEKKLRREDILHDSISTNIFRKGNDWILQGYPHGLMDKREYPSRWFIRI